jgi:hypothetical protein
MGVGMNIVVRHLSNGLYAVAVWSITLIALAGVATIRAPLPKM